MPHSSPSPNEPGVLPRRDLFVAGTLGITAVSLPSAGASASGPVLSEQTAASTVEVAAIEAGTLRATWQQDPNFTYDVVMQRTGGTAETLTDVSSPLEVQPSDWTATDDTAVYSVFVTSRSGDTSINSAPTQVTLSAAATGGTITTFTGDGTIGLAGVTYRVHTFTEDSTFTLAHARDVEHLIVAGGGGGGTRHGGGGGAGGVRTGTVAATADSYPVVVGSGGAGMTTGTAGADGADSSALAVVALGGGRGAGSRNGAGAGGSGGGSNSSGASAGAGTVGPPRQGYDGGGGVDGSGEGGFAGGGGGGAGAVGAAASGGGAANGQAGGGGGGVTSALSGTAVTYAGGGGGAVSHRASGTAGAAGAGGGGAGASFGWELYDTAAVGRELRWSLYTHDLDHPSDEAGLDGFFSGTPLRTGRAAVVTQSATGAASESTANVLNWNGTTQLYGAIGSQTGDPTNFFALQVTGWFIPLETGTYHFTISSDDAADVRIGSTTVAGFYGGRGMSDLATTNGTIALTAGTRYAFRVRMEDRTGGQGLRLFWQQPSQRTASSTTWHQNADELLGDAAAGSPDYSSPETSEEFDRFILASDRFGTQRGIARVTTQTFGASTPNTLDWQVSSDSSTNQLASSDVIGVSGLHRDLLLVVTGTFLPTETGSYTFAVSGDDAVDLRIGGTTVVAHYGSHAAPALGTPAQTGTISLIAGVPVALRIRLHQGGGGAQLRVYWRKPSQSSSSSWFQDAAELTALGRSGVAGTGGGGGAGGFSGDTNAAGGAGGSGIVVLRYRHDAE
jgi:hypothetical protein